MLKEGPLVELKTAQSVQTQNLFDLTIAGNTVGIGQLISSGTVTIAGGNNITLSQVGNGITISAGSAGAAFSAGASNLGNLSGTTGTVSNLLVIEGGSNITLSQSINAGSATITVIGAAAGTGAGINIEAGTQTATSGTVVFSNSNNVSFGMSNTSVITATATFAQSVQTQNMVSINGSTGAIVLTAGNNITLSENLSTITISAFNQSVQPAINAAAGTQTATSGTVVWSNSNNVTFGMSGSTRITASVADSFNIIAAGTQTANTTQSVVFSNSNNVSFGMSNSSIVTATATFAQTVQPAINLAAGTQTATSGTVVFSNSNNVTFGMSGSTRVTASVADSVNIIAAGTQTGNTTGTIVFSNSNNVSFGMSNNSVVTATATFAGGAGIAAIADNFGSSVTSGTVQFSFSNNVNFGFSGSTMTASALVPAIGVSTGGNTCNTTGMFDFGSIVLQGGSNITLCMTTATNNKNTIEIEGPGGANLSYFENFGGIPLQPFTPATHTGGTQDIYVSYQRIYAPANLVVDEVDIIYAMSGDSGSSGGFTISGGIYSFSVNSSSSTSAFINSRTTSYSSTIDARLLSIGTNYLTYSNNVSWTSGSNSTVGPPQYAGVSGTHYFAAPFSTSGGSAFPITLTQGEYLFGFVVSQNLPAATISIYGLSSLNIDSMSQQFANNQFFHKGYYSNSTTNLLSTISLSQITQNGSSVLAQPYFILARAQSSNSTTGTF